jgi:quinoprotein glucose dehydrogenase
MMTTSKIARVSGLVAGLFVTAVPVGQSVPSRTTWRDYGGSPDNARYVTFAQVTKDNVDELEVAWTYPMGDNNASVWSPIVVDDVMYVLAKNSSLVALDAATGKELWIHSGLQGIAPRGINYWESSDRGERRLLFQRNNHLEAIDARTGLPILTFGDQGAVDLREGFDPGATNVGRAQSSTPGKVFENLIILGSATGEAYFSTPGVLRAYDVMSGKLVWQFNLIPRPGEFGYETWPKDAWRYVGGANTWGEITVDAERGIAYFPTGSPTYDFYGADRHGANLFGTSLVALDARTGKRLWHFQMVHHDLWDYDNTAAPQLTTIVHDGRRRDVVAQAGKTGFLYVFDRVTGEPIWPIEERPVPPSDVPGEQAWATQPFPTNPPPFAPQSFTANDLNPYILTEEQRTEWRERLAKAKNGGLFTPLGLNVETVSMPGANGGANWGNTAARPDGIVFVQSINVPSIYRLTEPQPRGGGAGPRGGGPGRGGAAALIAQGRGVYAQRCQSCHAADLRGNSVLPSLVGVTARVPADTLREVISGGRLGMPPNNDLSQADMAALLAFLENPAAAAGRGGRGAPPGPIEGPVVASGGAPGARGGAGRGGGSMTDYPAGLDVPSARYTTGYGLSNTIVKPPYSTLTAYDLNTGTIKWQVPAGGDDPRAVADGGRDTGFPSERSGMISTSTGLLFHASGAGVVVAYDVDTGRRLWTGQLPAGSRGVPAMYEVDGRQYLVVNAGQGLRDDLPAGAGAPQTGVSGSAAGVPVPGRAYVVFALPR